MLTRFGSTFISRSANGRDLALDALRGLMVFGMVLVNHPPPGQEIYPQLMHAAWNGWTLADTIFPGFLFAVGVSIRMVLESPAHGRVTPDTTVAPKIARRFGILLVLNFLLVNFPYYFEGSLYLIGTLSLIAWCYLIAAFIALRTDWRTQLGIVVALVATQWAVYAFLPLPSAAAGTMLPDVNAGRYVDQLIFVPLFGAGFRSFENGVVLLPLLGAIASTLAGVLVGHWLRRPGGRGSSFAGLLALGVALCVAGAAWHGVLPINKKLWTGSYVLFMAGIATMLYAGLRVAAGSALGRTCIQPLRIVGVNALFFYIFAQSLQRLLVYGRLSGDDGQPVRLRVYVYETCFHPWVQGEFGSLVFALAFMSICFVAVALLYRMRIFIKV